MKKYLKYICFAVILATTLNACTQKEDIKFLKVETTSLTFGKDAANETVKISHNIDEVKAEWVGESLGTLAIVGDQLNIAISANTTGEDRVSSIMVFGKNKEQKKVISVSQFGVAISIQSESNLIEMDNPFNANKIIAITSNVKNWTIVECPIWVKAMAHPASGELVLDIEENIRYNEREGIIVLKSGNVSYSITISQPEAYYFEMPYIRDLGIAIKTSAQQKAINEDIHAFEQARGSAMIVKASQYQNRRDKAFQVVTYTVGKRFLDASITSLIPEALRSKMVRTKLEENGFEYLYTETEGIYDVYWNKSNKDIARIDYGMNAIYFINDDLEPGPLGEQQLQNYPTFESMPYGNINWESTITSVNAFEDANGGALYSATSTTLTIDGVVVPVYHYIYMVDNDDIYIREYRFIQETSKLFQSTTAYKDYTLVFKRTMTNQALVYVPLFKPTIEFTVLRTKEGFLEFASIPGGIVYYCPADRLAFSIRAIAYKLDGVNFSTCAEISFQQMDTDPNVIRD